MYMKNLKDSIAHGRNLEIKLRSPAQKQNYKLILVINKITIKTIILKLAITWF